MRFSGGVKKLGDVGRKEEGLESGAHRAGGVRSEGAQLRKLLGGKGPAGPLGFARPWGLCIPFRPTGCRSQPAPQQGVGGAQPRADAAIRRARAQRWFAVARFVTQDEWLCLWEPEEPHL